MLKNLKEKNSEPFIIFFSSMLVWWIKSHLLLFYLHAVDSLASGEDRFSDFMTDPDGMVQQGICCLSSIFSVLKLSHVIIISCWPAGHWFWFWFLCKITGYKSR